MKHPDPLILECIKTSQEIGEALYRARAAMDDTDPDQRLADLYKNQADDEEDYICSILLSMMHLAHKANIHIQPLLDHANRLFLDDLNNQ